MKPSFHQPPPARKPTGLAPRLLDGPDGQPKRPHVSPALSDPRRGSSPALIRQARRTSVKFWPELLVQFSCLVPAIVQLKLTGVWRMTEVPMICTVAPL